MQLNLIDGIDGLAAAVGIIASVAFGLFFYLSGDYGYTVMAAALLGLSAGIHKIQSLRRTEKDIHGRYRFACDRIYTGGFYDSLQRNGRSRQRLHRALYSAPSVSIAILIVPLFDTLRVIILRIRDQKSPFIADHRHVHHMMLRAGFSHREATLYISIFNIFMIGLALLLDDLGIFWLGLLLLALCLAASLILMKAVARKESKASVIISG